MPRKSSCCKLHRTSKAGVLGLEMHSTYCFRSRDEKKPCACGIPGCYDIPELTKEEMARGKRVTPEDHKAFHDALKRQGLI
jgi:hypothetical protein